MAISLEKFLQVKISELDNVETRRKNTSTKVIVYKYTS